MSPHLLKGQRSRAQVSYSVCIFLDRFSTFLKVKSMKDVMLRVSEYDERQEETLQSGSRPRAAGSP